MNKRAKSNSIRIIAGQWRGRRISVVDSDGLRPTTDRVRETLFNWLMHDLAGASCLDLFAGSGVLGFECLSRGASDVDFVEMDKVVARNVQQNLQEFLPNSDDEKANVNNQDAIKFLNSGNRKQYDIVFVDPPFQSTLALESLKLLSEGGWLNDNALVYLEIDSHNQAPKIPEGWELYRQGKAGQSAYYLYSIAGIEPS